MFRLKIPAALGVVLAIGLTALPADAQVNATVVLKSGERHTGRNLWYRIDTREVTLRASFTEAPRIPIDQVAYIDFGGTPDVNVNLSGSQHALVLRDGTVHKGQVIEIGHGDRADEQSDYMIIFRKENGEELRVLVDKVARVYFASSRAVATTGSPSQAVPSGEAQRITLSGTEQWTPTGIILNRGERVTVRATGEIRLGGDDNDRATPAGGGLRRTDPGNPMPNVPTGALIGRIGNGEPFAIGSSRTFQAPAAGELFLGINDSYMADNQGQFELEIRRGGRRR